MLKNSNLRQSARDAFAVFLLLTAPFALNACFIWEGEKLSLYGDAGKSDEQRAKEAKAAEDAEAKKKSGPANRSGAPGTTAAAPTCTPTAKGELTMEDPDLKAFEEEALEIESKLESRKEFRAVIKQFVTDAALDLSATDLKALSESILPRAAEQGSIEPKTTAAPVANKQPGSLSLTGDDDADGSPAAPAAGTGPAPVATTPPTKVAQHPIHDNVLKFVAYKAAYKFSTEPRGIERTKLLGKQFADDFLKHSPTEVAFSTYLKLYRFALESDKTKGLAVGNPEKAHTLAKLVLDKGTTSMQLGLGYIDTYLNQISYGFDAKDAAEAANKAVCFDPRDPGTPKGGENKPR